MRLPVRRPRTVIAVAVAIPLALAPGLARLELRTDGKALVPAGAAEVAVDAALRARFGVRDPIAVVIESTGAAGIYDPRILGLVRELSRAFLQLEGVRPIDVASLATEHSDRVRPGTLEFRPWLEALPRDEHELSRLRRDLEQVDIYGGTLLSSDKPASAAAILVGVPPDADRRALVSQVRSLLWPAVAALREAGVPVEGHLVGAPVAESQLGDHVLDDLVLLVPLALAVMALIFLLAFKSPVAVLLPLVEVGACLVVVFALMGWSGTPVYLTAAVLPVILTAVGVADELHLFTSFLRRRRAFPDEDTSRAVERTLDEMTRPVVTTSLTTAVGFLAFAAAPIGPVRAFGLFMAVGVLLCMAWSLLVVPAALALVAPAHWRRSLRGGRGGWIGAAEEHLGRLCSRALRRRRLVLATLAALVIAASPAASSLRVQDSWVENFAAESRLRRSTRRIEELFGGTQMLQVAVTLDGVRAAGRVASDAFGEHDVLLPGRIAEPPERLRWHELCVEIGSPEPVRARILSAEPEGEGTRLHLSPVGRGGGSWSLPGWLPSSLEQLSYEVSPRGALVQPELLGLLGQLEGWLAQLSALGVGRVVGPHEHLENMSFMLHARDPLRREIPEDPREIERVLYHYASVRGEQRLRQVFDPDFTSALTTVFLKGANYVDTARLIAAVREYARRQLEPLGLSIELGGDVAVSQALVGGIVRTQVLSLLLALLAVVVLSSVLLRSIALGLASALPPCLAVVAIFAVMGAGGIPLGVASAMFASMTLGIGVDYAIHVLLRRERARAAGADGRAATLEAVRGAGPAILTDGLAVGAGFGLLGFSVVPTNERLGLLMALALFACMAASLVALPVLLASRETRP